MDSCLLPCWFKKAILKYMRLDGIILALLLCFHKEISLRNLNFNSLRKQKFFKWTVVVLSKSEMMVYNLISTSAAELKSLCPSIAFFFCQCHFDPTFSSVLGISHCFLLVLINLIYKKQN